MSQRPRAVLPLLLALSLVAGPTSASGRQLADDTECVGYIFGYGSLVWKASAASTLCPGVPVEDCQSAQGMMPARIQAGYKRGFFLGLFSGPATSPFAFLRKPEWQRQQLFRAWQALTLIPGTPDDTVNGVLIPVTEAQKQAIFRREGGYLHKELFWDTVTVLSSKDGARADRSLPVYTDVSPEGAEWYSEPTEASPIVQSYVDLLVMGSIEIDQRLDMPGGHSFTAEVLNTTYGWSEHWVNDRPSVFRPWMFDPLSIQVELALINATHLRPYVQSISLPHSFQSSSSPAPGLLDNRLISVSLVVLLNAATLLALGRLWRTIKPAAPSVVIKEYGMYTPLAGRH